MKHSLQHAFKNNTTVPGAINVVTRCLGLDARMRLTGRVVSRESLDLGSTTLYDFRMLRGWLAASPLRLLNATRCDNIGVFLLEKPRQFVDKSERSRTSEASRNS